MYCGISKKNKCTVVIGFPLSPLRMLKSKNISIFKIKVIFYCKLSMSMVYSILRTPV